MRCKLETLDQLPSGRYAVRCKVCGKRSTAKNPAALKMTCGQFGEASELLTEEIRQEAELRGVLIGDVIAALTKAVGIPPCGACDARRVWLNSAQQWLTGWLGSCPIRRAENRAAGQVEQPAEGTA
jgi:hypothetical protein